jgi:hypothetical protein
MLYKTKVTKICKKNQQVLIQTKLSLQLSKRISYFLRKRKLSLICGCSLPELRRHSPRFSEAFFLGSSASWIKTNKSSGRLSLTRVLNSWTIFLTFGWTKLVCKGQLIISRHFFLSIVSLLSTVCCGRREFGESYFLCQAGLFIKIFPSDLRVQIIAVCFFSWCCPALAELSTSTLFHYLRIVF